MWLAEKKCREWRVYRRKTLLLGQLPSVMFISGNFWNGESSTEDSSWLLPSSTVRYSLQNSVMIWRTIFALLPSIESPSWLSSAVYFWSDDAMRALISGKVFLICIIRICIRELALNTASKKTYQIEFSSKIRCAAVGTLVSVCFVVLEERLFIFQSGWDGFFILDVSLAAIDHGHVAQA